MIFELWANVPDMDHVREWVKLGESEHLHELRKEKEKYIERWRQTSNYFRMREKGSFKVLDKDTGDAVERDF